MTIEVAAPRLSVRRRCVRAASAISRTGTINLVFIVEEGPRAYIERINIRGNTRTRDYVIRREFDVAEGDAYNRALIDRAERRLKNLSYFKTVKITNEPGSAPDRVIINVDVEEQSTGEFSISGGYSTADGSSAKSSVGERNLLGRGQYARAAVQYGQCAQAASRCRSSSLISSAIAWRSASICSAKRPNDQQYHVLRHETIGGAVRLGFALREDLALQLRYSIYQQEITLPNDTVTTVCDRAVRSRTSSGAIDCVTQRRSVAAGARRTGTGRGADVAGRLQLIYNTLDNNRNPTSGLLAEFKQDFAGVGGDVNFIRTTGDVRFYHEIVPDDHRRAAPAGRPHRRLGRQRPADARPLPDRARTWCAALRQRHRSARPDARTLRRTRSAARFTGARASNSRCRSSSCRRMSA